MKFLGGLFETKKEQHYLNKIYEQFHGLRSDDVFLVGYPKSGNTWLRFLIGNYLTGNKVDFSNSHLYVPGLIEHPEICNNLTHQRFISTHLSYSSFYKFINRYKKAKDKKGVKVVFIVRDGRDVAVSYYHHLLKVRKLNSDVRFDEFIPKLNKGLFNPFQSWGEYVNDWISKGKSEFTFVQVKYENLLVDPQGVMRMVMEFVNKEVDHVKLEKAIAASNFETMSKLEETQSNDHERLKNTLTNVKFVRKGEAGGWTKNFDEKTHSLFLRKNGDSLKKLNYKH